MNTKQSKIFCKEQGTYKNNKNLFSKFKVSCSFVFCFVLFSVPVWVGAATLYLSPQSQNIYQGESFIVEVRIDTEGEEINATEIGLTFPSNSLEVVDFIKGNSILTLWPKEPKIQEGKISFLGGALTGFNREGLLAKINFLAKETGKSKISFEDDSKVLLNDGKGTLAELKLSEGNYQIIKKPENLPLISSRTHSDQNKWCRENTLHFHWDLIEGAEYSYLLSKDSLAEPDEIPDRPEGELIWLGDIEYKGLDDGIYYFTLKQKLPAKDWLEKETFRAMIDTTSPELFQPKISKESSMFGGKYFLSFFATDKSSGIDYYEVKEGKRDFKKATSPYLLFDQNLRSKILVKTIDKAGNERIVEISPSKKPFSYWIIILILIGSGVVWWLIGKKKIESRK